MPGAGFVASDRSTDFRRHRLDISLDVDVAIVGAGYTGLWTALSLLDADPAMRVVVVERHHVGFGASGRNGGWCSALLPVSLTALERRHGRGAAIAWQRAMITTVDVVGEFAAPSAANGHDTHFHKGGTVTVARNPAQLRRLESAVAEARRFGFGTDDVRLLEDPKPPPGSTLRASSGRCSRRTVRPSIRCASPAPSPSRQRAGAQIVEGVDVVDIEPRRLTTTAGTIRADAVVVATEAYTSQLPGRRRNVLPIYSMMIGSEPLSDAQWAAIGLDDRQTFTVASHLVVYGQRTADGRMAFGGRGAPYHFGSRVDDRFDTDEAFGRRCGDTVDQLFPALGRRRVPVPLGWAARRPT